jgi:glyoxylase-like metal-dependent hydrolase (beta-lactamase superfamily II)
MSPWRVSIEYEFAARPDEGETLNIVDGIDWLRMPLPFALNHINLWLLEDGERWAIVDTGVGTDETKEHWRAVFDSAMCDRPASHVIVTHMHPDHVGCAGFLAHHFDVDLWMTRDEYMMCRILVADTGREAPEEGVHFYKDAGFTEDQLHNYQKAFGFFGKFVTPLPEAYKRMSDGDTLAVGAHNWRVITGGGHSPEHACMYDSERNILISGDLLLPTISSNVSVWPTEPLANPLQDWFDALQKLRAAVPEDVLVLPAHGKPFRGAHPRIDAMIREHEERLDTLREFCVQPQRAVDVFPAIYRSRIDDRNRIMATGEALAHLHYLVCAGELRAECRDQATWYQTL